jgi:hypothetical protein
MSIREDLGIVWKLLHKRYVGKQIGRYQAEKEYGVRLGGDAKFSSYDFWLYMNNPMGKVEVGCTMHMGGHGSDVQGPRQVLSHAPEALALAVLYEELKIEYRKQVAMQLASEDDKAFQARVDARMESNLAAKTGL